MSRIFALGIGAALMYFYDPNTGRKRRNDFKNQVNAAQRKLEHGKEVLIRDATNRTHGMLVETRQWIESWDLFSPEQKSSAGYEASVV